jgi:hypothetical protein
MNNPTDHLICNRLARGILFTIAVLGLSVALDGIGLSFFAPNTAQAQGADPELEQKADWQQRYRIMLKNQAILADNAEKLRNNYAQANRRNYPRGGERDQFLLDAAKAEADLAKLKETTAELLAKARRADLPRNWFYEVDDEDIQAPTPAARAKDRDEQEQSREGRNPLYLE